MTEAEMREQKEREEAERRRIAEEVKKNKAKIEEIQARELEKVEAKRDQIQTKMREKELIQERLD